MMKSLALSLALSFFAAASFATTLFAAEEDTSLHTSGVRRGLYSALTTGKIFFTGEDRTSYRNGWVIGFKAGYDFWKYFGAEGQFRFSGHDTTTGSTSANIPFSFFIYQFLVQAKGTYPITPRLHVHAGIGGGLFASSPNFNSNHSGMRGQFYGEMGLEYFMRTRGISVGIDPSLSAVVDLKGLVVQTTGFVRYTF